MFHVAGNVTSMTVSVIETYWIDWIELKLFFTAFTHHVWDRTGTAKQRFLLLTKSNSSTFKAFLKPSQYLTASTVVLIEYILYTDYFTSSSH